MVIGPIPELHADESFTVGWLQIEDEHGNMLVKCEVNLSRKGVLAGDIVKLQDLTITID